MLEKIKRLFSATDMTEGTPWKKIALFAIPMLLGNIAQQLYNTVDSIVVGKYIGDNALAAVGSAGPVVTLLIALFVGISTGASILVSQFFGAKSREDLSWSVGNCLTLTVVCSVIIMIVSTIIVRPLLVLLKTPDSIIDWCTSYVLILFVGNIGCSFYNILTGILRGLGDAFSALIYLLIASVINIGLDIYFVAELGWCVNGVAYATIIAQTISAILCFIRLKRMTHLFDLKWKYLRMRREYAGKTVHLGLPSGLNQIIFSMAMDVHCSHRYYYASRRFCYASKLFLWYCYDYLCRTECRCKTNGPCSKGSKAGYLPGSGYRNRPHCFSFGIWQIPDGYVHRYPGTGTAGL